MACDGCLGAGAVAYCIVRIDFEASEDCPCANCLIKVICDQTCKERADYYFTKKEEAEKW